MAGARRLAVVGLAASLGGLACATGSNSDGGSASGSPTSGVATDEGASSSTATGGATGSSSSGTGSAAATSDAETLGSSTGGTSGGGTESSGGEATSSSTTGFVGCGDGVVDGGEACDDGNQIDGDGCNADCMISGELLWSDFVGGGVGEIDEAFACAVDGFGNLYVAGYISIAGPSQDIWYRKYDDLGGELWTQTVDGPAMGKDQARGLAVEDSELFYVGGFVPVTMEGQNTWVRRHSADGSALWTATYNGPALTGDIVRALALDSAGGVVAVGHHTVTGEGQDVWMRRYSDAGVVTWTRPYGGAALGNDSAIGLAVADDGSIYVVGSETVTDEGVNMWLAKVDADGNLLWTRVRNGPANKADYLTGAATLPGGDVVVCGYEGMTDVPWQVWIRRYSSEGTIVWTATSDGDTHEGAYCNGIARDADGNLVITGGENVEGVRRIMVRKLSPDGAPLWGTTVPPAAAGIDYGRGLAIAPDNSIYVVGAADMGIDGRDVWIGRFRP